MRNTAQILTSATNLAAQPVDALDVNIVGGSTAITGSLNVIVTSTGSLGVAVQNFPATQAVTGTIHVDNAANKLPIWPNSGSVFAFAITSGTITQMNFRAAGYESILAAITSSSPMTLKSDVDAVWRFDTSTTGASIDELAVTGSVQADIIFAGEREDGTIPAGSNSLVFKGFNAGYARLKVTG